MEIDVDFITGVLAELDARVTEIKMIGGIAACDTRPFGFVEIPQGWKLDEATDYYVPPSWSWNPKQSFN